MSEELKTPSFLDKVWIDYPIPKRASIWSDSSDLEAEEDINVLLQTCVTELGSDLFVTEHIPATGMTTNLPSDTVSIICVKLQQPFQGNRQVKYTYDRSTQQVHLRYYPSIISYKRKLTLEDLDSLVGDEFKFAKFYILWKMSQKELQYLKAIKLDTDNGEYDLSEIQKLSDNWEKKYETLKEDILIYGSNN